MLVHLVDILAHLVFCFTCWLAWFTSLFIWFLQYAGSWLCVAISSIRKMKPRCLIKVACKNCQVQSVYNISWVPEDIFFLIDISRRSRVNEAQSAEEKKNIFWSQEHATSFPCEKSVQKLNWVADWILPCPQGINNITMTLIGYIEQLHCVRLVRYLILISRMEMRLRAPVTRGYFFSPRRFAPR